MNTSKPTSRSKDQITLKSADTQTESSSRKQDDNPAQTKHLVEFEKLFTFSHDELMEYSKQQKIELSPDVESIPYDDGEDIAYHEHLAFCNREK
ncbi:predicted protein [Uncinocarpus reesii 1704]|uniref:Uncharacterized protein n=1 Tax=Uncinocarpus reesii (strain UAMH 1704) TaxID=336963 RepID=C4JVR7_UNCRE|nr:uncharacterized protein UREG_06659 [Uncinocarpus reesii 1704]EEP81794.1 predicted protein [Uncinocarpus reesii 1704]